MNSPRVKLSRRHLDIFFANNFVMLADFRFADFPVEIPSRSAFKRRPHQDLCRNERAYSSVLINPCRTNNSALVYGSEIRAKERVAPIKLKFNKLVVFGLERATDAIADRKTLRLVRLGQIQTVAAAFLGHLIAPARACRKRD